MIIVAAFEHSIELEQALAELENNDIPRDQILVAFMDQPPSAVLGRSRDIRYNAFEVGAACATGSAVVGASVGFVLTLGPIIWGLIATAVGFSIGYGIYYFCNRNKASSNAAHPLPEVTVMIRSTKIQSALIKDTFWKYQALTVGVIDTP